MEAELLLRTTDFLSLEEFFRRKTQTAETNRNPLEVEAKKRIWLSSLDKLYNTIYHWLLPSIQEGLIEVSYENTELSENYVGTYSVKIMIIKVGLERIVFQPKGMMVIGAKGRVDMRGENGTVTLLLLNQESSKEWQWHIAVRTSRQKSWPLTKESLTEALIWVMQE